MDHADLSGGRQPIRTDNSELSPEVMACVKAHRCVPSSVRKPLFDRRVSHCCLAFELVYEESRQIAKEQGYLQKLLTMQDGDGLSAQNSIQLALVEEEIKKAWA